MNTPPPNAAALELRLKDLDARIRRRDDLINHLRDELHRQQITRANLVLQRGDLILKRCPPLQKSPPLTDADRDAFYCGVAEACSHADDHQDPERWDGMS
jgi:hypothetical protein